MTCLLANQKNISVTQAWIRPACLFVFLLLTMVLFQTLNSKRVSAAPLAAPVSDSETAWNHDSQERLQWIQKSLQQDEFPLKLWNRSWLAINGAYTVLGVVLALRSTHDAERAENWLNAGVSGMGAAGLYWASTWEAQYACEKLAALPEDTPSARLSKLTRAEALLASNAQAEEEGRSWLIHAFGVAGGAAIALPLWLGYHETDAAWRNFLFFVAGNELMIYTQTVQASRDQHEYLNRHGVSLALSYRLVLAPNTLGVIISF
jgi:hypothetical protein